jgi:hypothetical protein
MAQIWEDRGQVGLAKTEQEWAERASRCLKAEFKTRGHHLQGVGRAPRKHGFKETKASIANKLARGYTRHRLF